MRKLRFQGIHNLLKVTQTIPGERGGCVSVRGTAGCSAVWGFYNITQSSKTLSREFLSSGSAFFGILSCWSDFLAAENN